MASTLPQPNLLSPGEGINPQAQQLLPLLLGALGFKLVVRRHLFTNHVQPVVDTHIAKKLELLSEISHKVLETIV